jgi:hypothetical protein
LLQKQWHQGSCKRRDGSSLKRRFLFYVCGLI